MKPARKWKGKTAARQTPAQIAAVKENYQLFQLKGMLGHCRELGFVEHRNLSLYRDLEARIQNLIDKVKAQQGCRITRNQAKGCEDESCRAS